jgi:hypothetical protein
VSGENRKSLLRRSGAINDDFPRLLTVSKKLKEANATLEKLKDDERPPGLRCAHKGDAATTLMIKAHSNSRCFFHDVPFKAIEVNVSQMGRSATFDRTGFEVSADNRFLGETANAVPKTWRHCALSAQSEITLDLWLAEKGISPALANEASIPRKRMGIRHAEPGAEIRVGFRCV